MTATDLEVDAYTLSVTSGTPQTDVPLATINGAIKEISIRRRQSKGGISVYDIVIVHDNVGTTLLETTVRTQKVTSGTPVVDASAVSVAGVVQAAKAIATTSEGGITSYDIIIVHLNA